ncbi:MAG: hypothetical protein KDA41_16835, partial [Planctomycetales bacterium]|nr:hypothetical protein [Planctomycetales bacterium]
MALLACPAVRAAGRSDLMTRGSLAFGMNSAISIRSRSLTSDRSGSVSAVSHTARKKSGGDHSGEDIRKTEGGASKPQERDKAASLR